MSYYQLDIEKLYELYDKEDYEGISKEISESYDSGYSFIIEMARIWDENVHFFEGDQHIYYNEVTRQYEVIPTTKFNEFIPRPVTNHLFPIVNTLTSLLTRQKPQASVRENSTDDADINRARLGDAVLDTKWEMDSETMNHVLAAKSALLVGTVYRKDFWDTTGLATVDIPDEKTKTKKTLPLGDNAVSIRSPFEVIPDLNEINNIDKGTHVLEGSVQTVEWVKQNYDKTEKGYTGKAKDVKPNKDFSTVLNYVEKLKGSTGQSGQNPSNESAENRVTVIEIYLRPIKKHPRGLTIVQADDKVVYAGDTIYTYGNGVNWHPYTDFKFDIHPFRQPGISLAEQLVPLQRRYNAIDSLIILNRMTMASPQWLIPSGCRVPNGFINGAPGLNIPYVPGIGGMKPEKVLGAALDASVYREKEKCLEEMHMIAGDNEVMQGLRPEGVNTAAGLNILLEQSYSKYSPLIQGWEKFIERGQVKKLNIIRRKYKEPRKELISRIKSMNKDNLEVQIDDTFTGEALGDNIDIRVEAGSSLPRSKVVEQSNLKELAQAGLFGPLDPMQNPLANKEFLSKFGINKFPTPTDADVNKQKWENSLIRQKKFDQVVVDPMDNHGIHKAVIEDWMKQPEFKIRVGEDAFKFAVQHKAEHENAEMMTQMQQMQQQQQAAMPPEGAKRLPAAPAGQNAPGGQPPPPPPEGVAGNDMAGMQ